MDSRLKTLFLAAAIFLLNLYICHELFGIEYLRYLDSIEGAFIGIARFAMGHSRDLSWFPLWYDGIPYQNAYPPLLPLSVAVVAAVRGISPALAYHWVTALAYCLGPVAVFALVLRFSRSRWAAFVAGAFYSTASFSAWVMPAVRRDLGSPLFPRRLQALVYYGEGPHVVALTLLPVAILCLDWAMARRRAPQFALATVAIAASVATNWLGAFSLALMIVAYMIARFDLKQWKRDVIWLALLAAAAYCMIAPWIPPSTIALTRLNAQVNGGDFRRAYSTLPVWAVIMAFAMTAVKLKTRRLSLGLQFSILFTLLIAPLPLSYEWFGTIIVPQPARYHLEMEMAFAILFGVGAQAVFRNRTRRIAAIALVAMTVAMILPVRRYRNYARNFLLRGIDITTTEDWKEAQWLNRNWSGGRLMLTGFDTFWLTAFTDTPEVGGGFDQGVTDPAIPVALYGIMNGEQMRAHDVEYSVLWLQAMGAEAVSTAGLRNPKKFDGVLEPLWSDGEGTIYRVGPAQASLARVVPRQAIVTDRPFNALDVEETKRYVRALDDPAMPAADFRWATEHSAHITTNLQRDECVSIQIAYHRGWRATMNGRAMPIRSDGLGLMVLDPQSNGPATIDLLYDGGAEMRIAVWLRALAAIALLAALAHAMLKKSW